MVWYMSKINMMSIEEFMKLDIDVSSKNSYYLELAQYLYGNDIPEIVVERYNSRELLDDEFILETLNSHDTEKLKSKLKREYGYQVWFSDKHGEHKKSFYMIVSDENDLKDFDRKVSVGDTGKLEKFENILSFFNYYISNSYTDNGKGVLLIEPRYSDDVTNEVFNKHLYLYHFTDKESAKTILRTGLRCRNENLKREYPDRVYLYATDKKIDKSDLSTSPVKDFIKKVIGPFKFRREDISVLRIRNDRKINLYNDTAMKELEAVFTYSPIPPEMIKEIELK